MSVLPPSDMNARVDNNKRSVPGHEQRTSRKEGTVKRIIVEELENLKELHWKRLHRIIQRLCVKPMEPKGKSHRDGKVNIRGS